jgi:hypothetical protein
MASAALVIFEMYLAAKDALYDLFVAVDDPVVLRAVSAIWASTVSNDRMRDLVTQEGRPMMSHGLARAMLAVIGRSMSGIVLRLAEDSPDGDLEAMHQAATQAQHSDDERGLIYLRAMQDEGVRSSLVNAASTLSEERRGKVLRGFVTVAVLCDMIHRVVGLPPMVRADALDAVLRVSRVEMLGFVDAITADSSSEEMLAAWSTVRVLLGKTYEGMESVDSIRNATLFGSPVSATERDEALRSSLAVMRRLTGSDRQSVAIVRAMSTVREALRYD